MPRRVRPVSHEDQLTLVEHLDELRHRLIVSLAVFGVALALCFWQSSTLLDIASAPLPSQHERLLTFGVTEPFTTTVTIPPPAVASIRSSAICFWSRSWNCCACFIIC